MFWGEIHEMFIYIYKSWEKNTTKKYFKKNKNKNKILRSSVGNGFWLRGKKGLAKMKN